MAGFCAATDAKTAVFAGWLRSVASKMEALVI